MSLYAEHVVASARVRSGYLGETDQDLDHLSKYANESRTVSTLSPESGSSVLFPVHGVNSDNVSGPSLVSRICKNKRNKVSESSEVDEMPLCNMNKSLKSRGVNNQTRISFGRMKNFVPVDNKDLNKMSNFKRINDVLSFKSKKKDIKIKRLRDVKKFNLEGLDEPIAQMLSGLVDMIKPNITVSMDSSQFEVIEKLTQAFENIGTKLEDIPSNVFDDIGSLASGLADNYAAGPTVIIKTVCSSLVTMLTSYASDNIREIIFYVGLLAMLTHLRNIQASSKSILLISSIFIVVGKLIKIKAVTAVFSFITSKLSMLATSSEEPSAQMFSIGVLADIILGIFSLGLFPGIKGASIKKISTYLVELSKIGASLENIISVVMRILQYFLDLVAGKLGF
jgi:hypothetical protein